MLRILGICLLTLASLAIWTASSPAQIAVPVVQEPAQLPPPRIIPGQVMPPADVVPLPTPRPLVLRPMTHQEFAACFKPTPGCHEALLIHPGSGCPVLVRFTLPAGCPVVRVRPREVEFDYGRCEVEIRFKLFGKTAVNYQ